jgi:Rrf2 family protein
MTLIYMFSLSQKTEYAVIFLIALSKIQKGEYLSLSQISKYYNLPYRFLSQIASQFKKIKIVKSKEGSGGGYFLALPAEKITLWQVISLIEGETGLISCLKGKPCDKTNTCELRNVWLDIQNQIQAVLEKYTLKDLI